MAPTTTTTFRFTPADLRRLDRLARELGESRSDAVRFAVKLALRRDGAIADAREKQRAENAARDFIERLSHEYGQDAWINFTVGEDEQPNVSIDGEQPEDVRTQARVEDDRLRHFDLIDLRTDVGIWNAAVADTDETDFSVPLSRWSFGEPRIEDPTQPLAEFPSPLQ